MEPCLKRTGQRPVRGTAANRLPFFFPPSPLCIMPQAFNWELNTPVFKGKGSFNTGLYINGKFVDGVDGETHDVINPCT